MVNVALINDCQHLPKGQPRWSSDIQTEQESCNPLSLETRASSFGTKQAGVVHIAAAIAA
jgi:hypothetical protein